MDIVGTDQSAQTAINIVTQHVLFKPQEGQGWASTPELPTAEEILRESDIDELPENPVDVPWSSKEEYLAAQYEILRCEAVEGLRFSVKSFADHPRMKDDDFTNVYTRVRMKEYVMSTIGPLARVSFSTERSKYKIQWQQSKRLQPGKTVALSPKSDNFKTICKLAVIAQRPYLDGLDQDPPTVDLQWANPHDAVLDPSLEMVMIESLHGYFESARHALVGLQHAARTDSPLDKYLTGAHTMDNHPTFLKEDPIMDLSSLASLARPDDPEDEEVIAALKTYDIVKDQVPDLQDRTALDESQLDGLHRIISKELAIVQGPPGTGKTFTSVQAIKTMVANRRRHRGPPILVAAQTNHALDQILVHCIKAGASVLRIGGRTQTEEIKPCTLFQQRMAFPGQLPADGHCRSIDKQRAVNIGKTKELVGALFTGKPLDPDVLLQYKIITEAQHHSLSDDSMETNESLGDDGPFGLWLGDSLVDASVREDRHPTEFEMNEAEARKNLPEFEWEDDEEIENILAESEEELYRFRGTTIQLRHVKTGKDPANLRSADRAVKRALEEHQDLFAIKPDLRGAVYQYFQAKLLEVMTPEFTRLLAQNIELCKKRKAYKFLGNTELVKKRRIDIVGCTTTGLSKYRGCLAAMQPLSLLIEEAAETREANIVSALYPSVQQLILVGDHKQLAPKCDIQRLGDAPYNLNVSLFQRMVDLGMPFVMLKQQRRMKPALRSILNSFYPELFDHPSVTSINNRPDVLGMGGRNLWLFDHTWPEDVNSDYSKFNEHEAEMITRFFVYLVANGTPAEKITVLTFYKGQRKVLLNKLKRHPSVMGSVFNVCTVDSYQGEENDVILLSLVRSPQMDRNYAVGFLEDERRAVVAISRARRGFYVFGNVDNVLGAHQASFDLWGKICLGFAEQGQLNRERGLPIVCQPHGRTTWIKEIDDWGDNSGGCDLPCKQMRHCGHVCALKCHAIAHEDLPCGEPCSEKLVCGHGCQRLCGQKCFCDCQVFEDVTRHTQAAHQQHLSLEQKILQMGAEPTEMLMASLNKRNAARQQLQPPPGLPALQGKQRQGQALPLRGRNGRTGPGQVGTGGEPQAVMDSEWGHFVHNVHHHDERLRQEHLAAGRSTSEGVINEVYQPTALALADGRRVEHGNRTTQQVQLAYNQVAAGFSNGQGAIQSGMSHLTLANGPHHGSAAVSRPGMPQPPNATATGDRPAQHNGPNKRGGKGSRRSPIKSSGRQQNPSVQQPPRQAIPAQRQQPVPVQQPTPVQQPATDQTDLLLHDHALVDTADSAQAVGSSGTRLAPGVSSDLLIQFEPANPSQVGGITGPVPETTTSPTGLAAPTSVSPPAPATGAAAATPGQPPEQAAGGPGQKNGADEDEWLIEL